MCQPGHFGDLFGFGFGFARALVLIIVVMLVHLALVLMKFEFIDPLGPELIGIYVPCLTFHAFSFFLCA